MFRTARAKKERPGVAQWPSFQSVNATRFQSSHWWTAGSLRCILRAVCGRFVSQLPPAMIARLFRTHGDLPNLAPNWNTAPTQPSMVIRLNPATKQRRLDVLHWGLVRKRPVCAV